MEVDAPVTDNRIAMSDGRNTLGLNSSQSQAETEIGRLTGSCSDMGADRHSASTSGARTRSGGRFGTHDGKSNHPIKAMPTVQ